METTQSVKRKTISVWTHMLPGGIEGDVFIQSVQAFEQAQDEYAIEVVPIAPETYADRIIGSAQSGSLPCALEFDGPYLYNFVWSGYLQPIDRFVSPELKADLLPSVVAQATYNGQLYSVGQFEAGMMIYGNRRYLQKAGVRIATFDQPWSLDEFEQALEKLTELPEVEHAIDMKFNYGRSEFYTYGFSPILQSFGGDLIDRNGYQKASGVLDSPRSVEAMQRFQSWLEKGWVGRSTTTDDDFYGSKKAALAWVGTWMYKPHSEGLGEDLVVMPLPDFGAGPKTTMGNWAWSITSNCQDPAGAWTFIEFLLSPREMLRMTNQSGGPPSRRSVLAQSKLYGETGPLYLVWQQLDSDRIVPRPITPAYATISRVFAEAVGNIIDGADVKTELSRAAQEIDRDIEAHQGYPIQ
ncbi:MAG: sugar ABC transporter substrate-binding protein [Candidatus Thiodiazotropha taylori]|nr:sugar ABC transporter substrate-binding protein [Candidatus Thiodiazotropha taylori]